MSKTINPISAGLLAGLLLLSGCGRDASGVAAQKSAGEVQFDPTRPFGNAAPPSRKIKKATRPGDDFVPKNPKLARERRG